MLKVLVFLFLAEIAVARIDFPTGMNSKDRIAVMQILGFGSATKLLSNPYPLGGYHGIEIGLSTDVISTEQIGNLGNKARSRDQLSFTSVTVGKGLYSDVDVFFQFTPFIESDSVSAIGGQIRYGFFEASYLPIHLSIVLHGNSVNFQNQYVADNFGSDFVGGISVQDVTLYAGFGFATTYGRFLGMGGTDSQGNLLTNQETVKESYFSIHRLAGIQVNLGEMFLSFQIDRYVEATFAAKLGYRF
jgi:hypothetical protein